MFLRNVITQKHSPNTAPLIAITGDMIFHCRHLVKYIIAKLCGYIAVLSTLWTWEDAMSWMFTHKKV